MPFRHWWSLALACGLLLGGSLLAAPTQLIVASLDADPEPARVLDGQFDDQFLRNPGEPAIREGGVSPHWWRITALENVPAADAPRLVLLGPHLNHIDVWLPGQGTPLRRAAVGRDADLNRSARSLVIPLPRGLRAGQHVYVRVDSIDSVPNRMPIAIESAEETHAKDLTHATWRTAILTAMVVLALLALGSWAGIGERSCVYLAIMLLAQAGYIASVGGELRTVPVLRDIVAAEPLGSRLFLTLSMLAGLPFLSHYLALSERQARVMAALKFCVTLFVVLMLTRLASNAPVLTMLNNLICGVIALLILIASVRSMLWGERPARFLLLSLLPLLMFACLRGGEMLGWWPGKHWLAYAFPASVAFAGLALTLGLTDKLQQLRMDRDRANRMASYDGLTGASSRAVIEQQLAETVARAHKTGEWLSVVFFDIDHFKHVNDEHGHLIGDQFLRIIALRTRNRLRASDLFGRYGGDEMLAILPRTNLAGAIGIAENLRSAVNCRPLSIEGRLFNASLSLGVAQLARGESAVQLLERADAALYASKQAGRDRVSHLKPELVS